MKAAHSQEQARALIARGELFSRLSPAELDRLVRLARMRKVPARAVIFRKGDAGREMYAIVSGRVRISSEAADGREVVLGLLEPGDMFGEISLLDGAPRTATCSAVGATTLLVIERPKFLAVLEQSPALAIKLLEIIAARLRLTDQLIEDTLFLNLGTRLAKMLLTLAERCGRATPDGIEIDIKLSQQELGNLVAASRESVNKQLKAWESETIVGSNGGRVVIIDAAKLKFLVGQEVGPSAQTP
jgi:CRP-like cAMP-binding protein